LYKNEGSDEDGSKECMLNSKEMKNNKNYKNIKNLCRFSFRFAINSSPPLTPQAMKRLATKQHALLYNACKTIDIW